MNFLKRAGAILMVVAIFASSCNKYADDFDQLNKKLDALATQVAGVPQLSTDMAALKSQVTALQTAVAALPTTASISALAAQLTAIDGKVTTVSTNLTALAAVAATKTDVTASTAALTTLINKVTTDLTAVITTQIGSVNTLIAANQTALLARFTTVDAAIKANNDAIIALGTSITTQLGVTNGKIDANTAAQLTQYTDLVAKANAAATAAAAQDVVLAGIVAQNNTMATGLTTTLNNTTTILTQLAATPSPSTVGTLVSAMQLQITAMQQVLNQVLANTSMYTGAVSIVTDTDVDFFMLKLAQMAVINGPVTVNPTLVTKLVDLGTILGKITAVVGSNPVNLTAVQAKPLVLNNLTSISGSLTITGAALITQAAVDISKLSTVSGAFTYSLDGPINLPLLGSVGGLFTITPYTTTGATVIGTTSVNLPVCMAVGGMAPAAMILPSATSIVMPATGLTAITGVVATTVTVVNTAALPAGLVVTPRVTGATVDLSGATSAVGALSVAVSETINLSKLATAAGAVTLTTTATGTVNLDMFNSNQPVTINGAKTVSMPVWAGGGISLLTAPAATTVSLPAFTWAVAPALAAVRVLTVGAVNFPVALAPYTLLTDVTLTGKTVTTWATLNTTLATTAANSVLKNVTLGGMWKSVDLTGLGAMTGLTTSGVINGFNLTGANAVTFTACTLGHTGFTSVVDGTPGAVLTVTANTALTSLTATALDKVVALVVTGNTSLYTLSLPACVSLANNGVGTTFVATITGNAIRGSFTPAVAAVPLVTPYSEAVISCPTLKALQTWITLATSGSGYPTWSFNMEYNNNPASPYATAAPTLSALMAGNDAVSVAIDDSTTPLVIDKRTELAIIQ